MKDFFSSINLELGTNVEISLTCGNNPQDVWWHAFYNIEQGSSCQYFHPSTLAFICPPPPILLNFLSGPRATLGHDGPFCCIKAAYAEWAAGNNISF